MSKSDASNPVFTDEKAATKHLEASRWPDGPYCPHCGSTNVHRMKGKTQAGMFLCNDCRDKFTPRTGTVMERSHIPVHKWLLAIHLMSASKKGVSSKQLERMLGISYKSAWFLSMRIREVARRREGRCSAAPVRRSRRMRRSLAASRRMPTTASQSPRSSPSWYSWSVVARPAPSTLPM